LIVCQSRFPRQPHQVSPGLEHEKHAGQQLRSPNQIPIRKSKVNKWVRENEAVLACRPAAPLDGGRGAANILLRRK
jgi:hypothetical protein